jgi:membrane protease YdiL (CAAX protease family)
MNPIASLIKRYPLVTFFIIAYATSFIGGYLSELYPSDWWAVFVYGPFIGAFIVTATDQGRDGLKDWLSRIVRWRVGFQWYIVALLLPVGLRVITFGLNLLLGAAMPTASQLGTWPDFIPEFIFILLFIGLAEEPGFRGFALQRLLAGRSVLVASLIVGVLHTVWHLPLFINGSEPLTIIPIILGGAILLSWLYVHTNGSVLLTMLMHASVNTTSGYFSALFSGAELARQTALLAGVYVAAALILVVVAGPNLTWKSVVQLAEG